jgi:hypothetical protein
VNCWVWPIAIVAEDGDTAIDCKTATPVPVRVAVCGLVTELSVTTNSAVRVPAAVGAKLIVTGQDAPAANVAGATGQVLVCEKSPVVWIEVIDKDTGCGCMFAICIVLVPLVAPILIEPKLSDPGDSTTGDVPFPLRFAVVGDPNASFMTVRVPEFAPRADGAKTTLIEQVPPAANVPGDIGQVFVWLKFPLAVIDPMDRGMFCPFLRAMVFGALELPKVILPNERLAGDNVTG